MQISHIPVRHQRHSTVFRELLRRWRDLWFSNFCMCQNHLEGWLKHRWLGLTPEFLIRPVWLWANNWHFWQGDADSCSGSWKPLGWTFLDWHLTYQWWGNHRWGSCIVLSLLCVCIFLFITHCPVSFGLFFPGPPWGRVLLCSPWKMFQTFPNYLAPLEFSVWRLLLGFISCSWINSCLNVRKY